MKKLLFLIIIICSLELNAQNYLISFAGTGASSTVNSVKVENLKAGTSLTLNGSDILRLTLLIGINDIENNQSSKLKIYPNPMTDNSILQITPPAPGSVTVTVIDMTGKPVAQIQSYLENYPQEFRLSGINSGFYLVSIKGKTYQYSGKLLSNGRASGTISIEKISNYLAVEEKQTKENSKGSQDTVDMAYSNGDRLRFTGLSGIYSTAKTDIPAGNKTITFNFIDCRDGDNNNYPVVEIGTQVWMAENLKTTRYRDGTTGIPLVTDNTDWGYLTTPAYCWYNNNEANYKATYGALYNWYTAGTGNLCPIGWHVPSDADWTTLTTFLGGFELAGGKLKETGTTHWTTPNAGADNSSGFTALPAGFRFYYGAFANNGLSVYWWSITEFVEDPPVSVLSNAWYRYLYYSISNVFIDDTNKKFGFSIRCLRN